jgi:hypothetical protein
MLGALGLGIEGSLKIITTKHLTPTKNKVWKKENFTIYL